MPYAPLYLLMLNLVALALIRVDKSRAVHREWRIPESRFLWMAILGGSIGIYAGCRLFRHKINHPKFMVGVPIILAIQLIAVGLLFFFFQDRLP